MGNIGSKQVVNDESNQIKNGESNRVRNSNQNETNDVHDGVCVGYLTRQWASSCTDDYVRVVIVTLVEILGA